MFGIQAKCAINGPHCNIIIKIALKQCLYTLVLIFCLSMYFHIFNKYISISIRNVNRPRENSIAIVPQQYIKPKPSLAEIVKSTSMTVTTLKSKGTVNSVKYYVKTSQCEIPYVNPFTKEILEMFRPIKYENCTRNRPLYSSTYKKNLKKYVLQLNKELAIKYFPQIAKSKLRDLKCRYREINREKNVDSYKLLEFKALPKRFIVPRNIDSIIVNCTLISTNEEVYSDAFAFVQYNKTLFARKKPGVLLIGIDKLSRVNLRRVMPKTFKYLENSWFELQGYNKVAGNTFRNLMPILTGYNLTVTRAKCHPEIEGGMESRECKIIWETFKKVSYRTAYAEDMPDISTFNYGKSGFKEQPTDFYSRPWMKAIEKYLPVKKRYKMPFCIGYRHAGDYIYDYAHQLAKVYEGKNIFGLFWTNTYSHRSYDDPSMIDGQMVKYFKSFEKDGVLDSAIVMFFSDNGSRQSKLRKLPQGYFEERLPMFFISLPKSFKKKHPKFVKALQVNRNRLTSPYDIHMTLNHILQLYEPKLRLPRANGCKKCQSIFHTIPENRTCLDAGIASRWCTCL